MSILNEVKRIFGVNGKSIEEALSNADPVSGGSGGTVLVKQVVDPSTGNVSLSKTYAEINQLASNDKVIVIKDDDLNSFQFVDGVGEATDGTYTWYDVSAIYSDGTYVRIQVWRADTVDDYPVRVLD